MFQHFGLNISHFSAKNIMDFNTFVDGLFKTKLFNELDLIKKYELMSIRKAVYNFIKNNNMELDKDCDYWALRKAYYRYEKKT